MQNKIELGDKVRDSVSGFEGIAIGRTTWLQGCDRITVQPKVDKDGKPQDAHTFDEPQLIIVAKKKVKAVKSPKTGGYDISIKQKDGVSRH